MSFCTYVRSLWPAALVVGVLLALIVLVLSVSSLSWTFIFIVVALGVLCALLCALVCYARKRRFYLQLEECVGDAQCPLWLTEFVDEPEVFEERQVFEALRSLVKVANDRVAASRRAGEDYREYIETWVHEAKTPIAAARLMVEALADEAPDAQERAAALEAELDRMEGYVEQALFFARSETLERDYLIRSHSLSNLVSMAVRANARALISAHMAPCLDDLSYVVFTDEKWMLFILGQVIQNSVKYARPHGAQIAFSAALADRGGAHERVVLRVDDNGRGVSAADLPRVFERGFTGDAGRDTAHATGIGLYLVSRLCAKMGIGVSADSVPGEGFTVRFSFPTNKYHYFEDPAA